MKDLPPLRSLIAFEAAVRHQSFSKAAEELFVTPGAVGQMIRKLESWLGVKLFLREVRRIAVTPAGAAYFGRVSAALSQISLASLALRQHQRNQVRISMSPSIATKWFAPRMARFIELHRDVNLQISATAALVDFDNEPIDLAIRHFKPRNSSKLEIELLFPDEARVYCSPQYRDRLKLKRPQDCSRATLLLTTLHPHWERWFERFTGLGQRAVGNIATIRFDQSHLAIDAARRHQGVVLSCAPLTEQEILSGELIEPFEARLPLEKAYYLVYPKASLASGGVVDALRTWLRQEAAQHLPSPEHPRRKRQ